MRFNRSKYRAKKTTVDGFTFDSKREAERYTELTALSRTGRITGLKRQVKYELVPPQYEDVGTDEVYMRGERKGERKVKHILVEKGVDYIADFVYTDKDGNEIVEDVKGFKTKEYILKRKLMLYVHKIKIKEV